MPVLEMKVIVGTPENATPIFSDQMETVVFSPDLERARQHRRGRDRSGGRA